MRRRGSLLIVTVVAAALAAPGAALGAPSPTPSPAKPFVPPAVNGTEVCKIKDERMTELSGLIALDDGYAAINDGTENAASIQVFFLDAQCRVKNVFNNSDKPFDTEDMAIGKDGTIWVGDIGDNKTDRPSVSVWKVPAPDQAGKRARATIYRMTYPDGKARDAEALLLDANDNPVIVAKFGPTVEIFTPTAPLVPNTKAGVPLQAVGTFTTAKTGTEGGPIPVIGPTLVTGGANSADRKKVVLRTYTDAYEWDVKDGDVVAAITKTAPRITPLPNEPQGESIAYAKDGSFLTVSEVPGQNLAKFTPAILKYAPSGPAPVVKSPAADKTTAAASGGLSYSEKIALAIAGIGVLGLAMLVVGVVGIKKSRRRRAGEIAEKKKAKKVAASAPVRPPPAAPDHSGPRPVARAQGGVYGGTRPPVADDSLTDALPQIAVPPRAAPRPPPAEPPVPQAPPRRSSLRDRVARPTAPGVARPTAAGVARPPRPEPDADPAVPPAPKAPRGKLRGKKDDDDPDYGFSDLRR